MQEQQKRLEKREELFDQKLIEIEDKKTRLEEKAKQIEDVKMSIEVIKFEQNQKLQEIAKLTKEQAEEQLLKQVEVDAQEALQSRFRKMEEITEEEIEIKSRKLLSLAITRFASSVSVDGTTTAVELPNDEMKGRIIGKEGRNIKAIELQTGTEIIVDDTPNMITISGFSPIRRQVAKRALDALIKDGRIQPSKIEELVKKAQNHI